LDSLVSSLDFSRVKNRKPLRLEERRDCGWEEAACGQRTHASVAQKPFGVENEQPVPSHRGLFGEQKHLLLELQTDTGSKPLRAGGRLWNEEGQGEERSLPAPALR
jgi:hypothetical protein